MNWKDYLNYLKPLIKHITRILIVAFLISELTLAQSESTEAQVNKIDSIFIPSKSAWTAVLMSAVLPGAGQIYNQSYWKAPLIWAISGWLVYNWFDNNKNYKNFNELYLNTQNNDYRRLRTFYRDQRDLFAIYMGLTYFLNLVDAYVDAQLFDFTVEEDFFTRQPRFNIKFKLR